MPDDPIQTQTPGAVLADQTPPPNAGNMPLASRPGPPSLPAQPPAQQQAPPPPTPQQAVAAKHQAIGAAASFLFGQQRDPETGEVIKQKPGTVLGSLLLGAMYGASLGSEGNARGGSVGGFLGGMGRGASGVEQQNYQRQQQAQEQAMKRQQMTLEERRAEDEHTLHEATVAHLTAETTAFHHQQEFQDQEAVDKKNKAAQQYTQALRDAGGRNAPIAINGKVPANGEYSAPDIAAAYMKNNSILQAPPGMVRHFVDVHDASDLEYVAGKGWVNEAGDPVDMSKSTTVRAIDVPENQFGKPVQKTGKELNTIAGYQLIPQEQEDNTFNVPINAVTGLYTQNLKNLNEQAQTKQRLAAAGKAASQATKRGTPAQFAQVEAKKAAALAKAETAYQKGDLDADELAKAKAAAQKTYNDEVTALGGSIAPAARPAGQPGRAAPASAPKKGETQIHAGFNYTFNGSQWIKGQPAPAQ